MTTKTVYCFYFYDPTSKKPVHSPRAATIQRIEQMDGVPIRETGLEVEDSQVDSLGFLIGPHNCNNAAHVGGMQRPPV